MKNLQDLINAVNSMPITEFKDGKKYRELQTLLQRRNNDWYSSPEYNAELKREAEVRKDRQKKEQAKKQSNAAWAMKHLKPGMFIKVRGTKDGKGLREVMTVDKGREMIVCRKWIFSPGHYSFTTKSFRKDERATQWSDKVWARPDNQITEHQMDKITGVFEFSDSMEPLGYKVL